ncbi:SDR family oxidoreductase [Nakamurella sp. PAMC28650]|jgi:short-subunit dehydrogenase|uniref:SDR family NAD(P)-dependent oxidoreductase n=1 Tax=Nakamurella sp. PAMC28650 TaxID=2762325 RepID=UPI00164D4C86|nr:SDR family oxidoreductase [Nakamurella sp. PAMC28650]QNK81434.1 SDR family oxidoreductase [Nakamurella sp. PAMC28650]
MPTAMVTGATAGIGAAFSRHLAASGYRLVIVARDAARLETSRAALLSFGAPEVEVISADLTVAEQRAAVVARLTAEPVDLLVNNAGVGLGKDFLHATEAELQGQIDINVTAVTMLARAALPGMVARGHGAVINVASVAGLVPGRGTTYAGSKAFVISLSEGLAMSLAGTGVRVQALCPGFVRTEFHERASIDMSGTSPGRYVDIDNLVVTSLADLRANRILSVPGRLYALMAVLVRLLPRGVVRRVASKVNNSQRT